MDPFFEEAADTPVQKMSNHPLTFEGEMEMIAIFAEGLNKRRSFKSLRMPVMLVVGLSAAIIVVYSLTNLLL